MSIRDLQIETIRPTYTEITRIKKLSGTILTDMGIRIEAPDISGRVYKHTIIMSISPDTRAHLLSSANSYVQESDENGLFLLIEPEKGFFRVSLKMLEHNQEIGHVIQGINLNQQPRRRF